jgi:signal transduction histidine kinase/ActR/RegA family two-component response regulator
MKLRSHLLLLTLGTILPLLVFALIAVGLLAQRERTIFQSGAKERTVALLTAIDYELDSSITTLRALAASPQLDSDDVEGFTAQAMRVLPTQLGWKRIHLTPIKGPQPELERAAILPVIADPETGRREFSVRVPVVRDGALRYVLSASIDVQRIAALLESQRLPRDWAAEAIDQRGQTVARLGRGVGGDRAYRPRERSVLSGWTAALDIPMAPVQAGLGTAAVTMTAGIIVALIAALMLAAALGHRISKPISSLAAVAKALAAGQRVEPPDPGSVEEIRDVSRALADAATAVRAREDALRAADRAKDEFLAMLSHELRNPLGALAAAGEVLRQIPSKEATDVVVRQVDHMARLVEDLLDVSRVTRGKISLARQPVNLAEAVHKVEQEWRVSGRLTRHTATVQAAQAWVQADEARLHQIIANLLGNAVKYTPDGGRITVSVKRHRNNALLQVRDTGIGMSAELASRVFDLFVQGDRALDRRAGGLGIGLTLVKRLAELHGGTAFAASAGPGQGSLFTVVLPAIETRAEAPPVPAAAQEQKRRHSILLIEDSEDARRSLMAALKLDGHEVYAAPDGRAGLAAVEATNPEVAVIDIGLPGLDGYEVAQSIRGMPARDSMVLIALTGYGQPEAVRRARDAGFDEHVLKPIAPEQLVRLIDVACAARARRAGARPSA